MNYNINLQKIADELDFDLEDIEMLIEVFLKSADETLVSMQIAIKENNLEQIFKSAHSIKGSAANLTLHKISDLAKEIEHEAREKNSLDYLSKYNELKVLINNIIKK